MYLWDCLPKQVNMCAMYMYTYLYVRLRLRERATDSCLSQFVDEARLARIKTLSVILFFYRVQLHICHLCKLLLDVDYCVVFVKKKYFNHRSYYFNKQKPCVTHFLVNLQRWYSMRIILRRRGYSFALLAHTEWFCLICFYSLPQLKNCI